MAANSSLSSAPLPHARRRLLFFAAILLAWFALIALRLVQLQIFQYGDYLARAERQQQRSLDVAPERGAIYDRNGQPLAMSVMVDSVFAVPSEIPDPQTTATLLGRILGDDPHEIAARFSASRAFCWVARKLNRETADRIRALNLKGIYFQKEPKRFDPNGELAAQVLGYVGLDDEGLGGIERSYDGQLRGKPGTMLISLDARRKWFGRVERQPEAGENLVLTLDERIQYIAERALAAAMARTQAQAGTVIVEDPRTGEILALANRPTFDPNNFSKFPSATLSDRAVSDIYEPGSTFKIVTVAAALEEKLTRPEEVFDCQMGSIDLAGRRIHDHQPFGNLTVSEIIAHSSDVGAIKIGLRLGDDRLDHYIRAFGFGSPTGIELPGETRGLVKPVSRWSKVSIGAISMGQEIGISAVQLAAMISTIADDGIYNAPRIVAGELDGVRDGRLKTVVFHPAEQHRVISSLTAAEMKKMLEGVVLYGTGRKAILDGYTSAGKTGTAQKADPGGGYSRSNYIASFAGFAPVNNPAITVAVILDSPHNGSHEGGAAAAPVFASIAQQVLMQMNVERDAPITDQRLQLLRAAAKASDSDLADSSDNIEEGPELTTKMNNDTSPAAVVAQNNLAATKKSSKAAPKLLAAALPLKPSKAAATIPAPTLSHGAVAIDLSDSTPAPSLIGLPMRDALAKAEAEGFELEIIGSGIAREQNPPPGAPLAAGSHIAVRFGR